MNQQRLDELKQRAAVTEELLSALDLYCNCEIDDISATRISDDEDDEEDCSEEVAHAIQTIVDFAWAASRVLASDRQQPEEGGEQCGNG